MSIIAAFFSALLYMAVTQNPVFTGGYGTSETIRTAARPRQIVLVAAEITFFSTVTALLCRLLALVPIFKSASATVNIVLYILILSIVYILTVSIWKLIFRKSGLSDKFKEKFYKQTGISAFNTIVLALPFIGQKAALSITESIGMGIGAGIAFALATWLVHAGLKTLEANDKIPDSFKGLPIVFIYIAILAMAFTGISGTSLFF